jgi:hypothetical protein
MKSLFGNRRIPSLLQALLPHRRPDVSHRTRRSARRPGIESLETRTPLSAGVISPHPSITWTPAIDFQAIVFVARVTDPTSPATAINALVHDSTVVGTFDQLITDHAPVDVASQTETAGPFPTPTTATATATGMVGSGVQIFGPRHTPPPAFDFHFDGSTDLSNPGPDQFLADSAPDDGDPPIGQMVAVAFSILGPTRPAASPPEDDSAFAGPLPLDDPADDPLSLLTNPTAADRSELLAFLAPNASGRSTALDIQSNSGDWMSYLAGDAGRPLAELTDSSIALLVFDDTSTDPEQPASITNGEAPLAFLLSAPDLPDQARPRRDSQIAELVAFSDSSLALAATLWTMPSDLQAPTGDDARSAALAADSKSSAPSIPSWTAYLIGLDQAVQRSALDLREELAGTDRPSISPGRRTEWQGPILPAGNASEVERNESAPNRKATPSTSRQSPSEPHIPARDAHAAQAPESSSTEPSSLAIAVIPAISALSLFGAGWFWRKRPAWLRPRSRKMTRPQRD